MKHNGLHFACISPVFNIDNCISECNNEIDLECLWKKWIVEFKRISNIHAPLRHIRVKNRNNPWFDDNIQNLIFSRDYYHQKAISTKDSFLWERYKTLRNEVTNCIREAKRNYYNSTITACCFQPKEMWRTIRQFLPNKSSCSST